MNGSAQNPWARRLSLSVWVLRLLRDAFATSRALRVGDDPRAHLQRWPAKAR